MRSVIFDLDGTLADTSGDLITAANSCLKNFGAAAVLDPIGDQLVAFHGARAMLNEGLSRVMNEVDQALIDEHYPKVLEFYDANIANFTTLYDGVESCLETLKDKGYALGICTNKPEWLAIKLIEELGLTHHFGALLGADTLPVRKPDPEHLAATARAIGSDTSKTILIGDTITDRKTAANANVPCVLVAFGPEGEGVSRLKPDALLDHYDDLPQIVAQFLE